MERTDPLHVVIAAPESRATTPAQTPSSLHEAISVLALIGAIALWFVAIRAPLWLDETSSYWSMAGGFWKIPSRQGISFAAHSYILWIAAKLFGTSPFALRIPEILAMLGAVYLLYFAAKEMYERDVALIAAVIFSLHPIVIFAAIDVRPYAFAALSICAAILCLVRLRRNTSNWLPAAFGLSAALILYFQTLFGVMLPLLLICFFYLKRQSRERMWQQLGIALGTFTLAILPTIPRLKLLFHSGRALAFEQPPGLSALIVTMAPLPLLFIYAIFLVGSAVAQKPRRSSANVWPIVVGVTLGLVPLAILFVLSTATPLQVFVARYRLVALPGLALCWALLASALQPRWLRLAFCVSVVVVTGYLYITSPYSKQHGYTWKYALEFANANASPDRASLLICSDFPQSPFLPMPVGDEVKDSALFTQLSYYQVNVPVVGLPRAVNDEAIRDTREFLKTSEHSRFLALGFWPSYPVLQMVSDMAAPTHEVRLLGTFNDIRVLEFTPREQSRAHH